MRRSLISLLLAAAAAFPAAGEAAGDGPLRLVAPATLEADGFLRHLLPRFSLKTGVRVAAAAADGAAATALLRDGEADMAWVGPGDAAAFAAEGGAAAPLITPIITGPEGDLHAVIATPPTASATRFLSWLTSEIGGRTIAAYAPDGAPRYAPYAAAPEKAVEAAPPGDPALGERVALTRCGRCHVVSDANRFAGIGSTPSFGALRALPRWRERFEAFWTLNPHPSFTQVEGVTEPFDPALPPPIAPIEMTLEEAEAILAFVAGMVPKDLGPPLAYQ